MLCIPLWARVQAKACRDVLAEWEAQSSGALWRAHGVYGSRCEDDDAVDKGGGGVTARACLLYIK